MSEFPLVRVLGGTNLRRGGSTRGGPDVSNVVGQPYSVGEDWYPAYAQCAGEDVSDHGNANSWWLLIDTPHGRGWVSATRVEEGPYGKPVDEQFVEGVPTAPTVFAPGGPTGHSTLVTLVSAGGPVYRSGSTRSDDSFLGHLDGGSFNALVQCPGEEVDNRDAHGHGPFNFWWVQVDTPYGRGWVNAVYIRTGDDDGPIPGVRRTATIFSVAPDLLP